MKTVRQRQNETMAPAPERARRRGATPIEPPAPKLVELNPVIHERTRLAILTALTTTADGVRSFSDLRDALHLTDGNLTTHLRTLGQAGLVEVRKTGAGRGSSCRASPGTGSPGTPATRSRRWHVFVTAACSV